MATPAISQATIRANSTPESFSRGEEYFNDGAVLSIIRRGDRLTIEVQGSSYSPYAVTVELANDEIVDADCTCPYDWGGWCKHIVAALLACAAEPETVEERQPIQALLANLDAQQLRGLIERLAQEWPDILAFIERWIGADAAPSSGQTRSAITSPSRVTITVDLATIRRQVAAIAQRGAEGIYPYVEQVQQLLESDQTSDALAVLETISEEFIGSIDEDEPYFSRGRYRDDYYDDDDAGSEYYSLLESLGALWAEVLLSVDLSPDERSEYQEMLMGWDEELGAVDWLGADDFFSLGVAALEYYWDYPPLVRVLAGEITERGAWEEEAPFLADELAIVRLRVLERQGRLQEYLYLAQAEGQTTLYINMLAKMGRADAAVAEALQFLQQAADAHLVAQSLDNAGENLAALRVAEHGLSLAGYQKRDLAVWLREKAAAAGNWELALRAGSVAVADKCQLDDYTRLQQLAGDKWLALRETLLNNLRQANTTYNASPVDIFLYEGLIDDAIAAVNTDAYDTTKIIAVMEAASQSRPEWVIRTAQKRAESIMNAGKADRYSDAVSWLRRAKEVFVATGRPNDWRAYLAEIRAKHGRKWKLMGLIEAM